MPLALPMIDWFIGRNLRDKNVWLEKIPFFALALVGGLFTLSLRNPYNVQYLADYYLWERLIFACYALTEYLTKLIVPVNLLYVYPFPMIAGDPMPVRFFLYPVIAAAIVGAFVYYRKHAVLVFGTLFFLLNVCLTLHIISISRISIVADRWIYPSSVGFFMTVAWYGANFLKDLSKLKKGIACLAFAAYFVYLAGYAMKRAEVWHDNDSLKKEIKELIKMREDYEKGTFKEQ